MVIKMTNRFVVVVVVLVLLSAGSARAADESNLVGYTHPQCGYSFKHPNEWEVVSTRTEKRKCQTTLRPKTFGKLMADYDVDLHSIKISQESESFLCAASSMGFDYFGNRWIITGGTLRPQEATTLTTNVWTSLRAVVTNRCYHENGGYAGLCDDYFLVAQDSEGRVLTITGGSQTGEVFELVFRSFSFKKTE